MSASDQLVEKMLSLVEQREQCAEKLNTLAEELETHREKFKRRKNAAKVLGATALIGIGVATVLSAGLASPFSGSLGAGVVGAVASVGVAALIIQHFMSSATMKEAQKIEKESKETAKEIKHQFEQLKEGVKELMNCFSDADEGEELIMSQFRGVFTRRNSREWQVDFRKLDENLQGFVAAGQRNMRLDQRVKPELMVGLSEVLEASELIKHASKTGVGTALTGGAMVVEGASVLIFELDKLIDHCKDLIEKDQVTEASQSLRDTAEDVKKMTGTLRKQLNDTKQKLEVLSDVKRCIENSNRSSEERKKLIETSITMCENETVKTWLRENSESGVVSKLVDLFSVLTQRLDEEEEKIQNIHIIFVAHGAITDSMIPASCLLPLSTIEDVLLYSPWNCTIDANVAYAVATGHIEPEDRKFVCGGNGCQIPDDRHQPTDLPDRWNSMEKAGGQMIPNIFVRTLRKPEDGAWERFEFLKDEFAGPGRNRIVIPFILPEIDSSLKVPFPVVTLAMSLGLFFSGYRATVHLAACLSKRSEDMRLDEGNLKEQYACTIDGTRMSCSEEPSDPTYPELYRALEAVFG